MNESLKLICYTVAVSIFYLSDTITNIIKLYSWRGENKDDD